MSFNLQTQDFVERSVESAINSAISTHVQECVDNESAELIISFSDMNFKNCNVNFTNINQDASVKRTNFKCVSDNTSTTQFKSNLLDKLRTALHSNKTGIGIGISAQTENSISENTQTIANIITRGDTQNCISQISSTAVLEFARNDFECDDKNSLIDFNNINQQSALHNVLECTQKDSSYQGAIDDIANSMIASGTQDNTGFTLPSIVGTLIMVVVVIVVIVVAVQIIKKSSGNKSNPQVITQPSVA